MELKDVIELMSSSDYEDRLRAEYWYCILRLEELEKTKTMFVEGKIPKTKACPYGLYDMQIESLKNYMTLIEIRAKIEGIE